MRPIHWIVAGVGVGAALTFLLFYDPSLQHDTGYDGVEGVADHARAWGTKKRFSGGTDSVVGRVKEAVGRATGDDDLAGEGVLDQAAGTVKDAAGQVGEAVGQTIHELNR